MTAGRWAGVVSGAIAEPAVAQSRSAGETLSPTTPAQPPALACPRRAGRMRGSRHPAKLRAIDWNATGDEPERPHPRHPRLPDAGHPVLRHQIGRASRRERVWSVSVDLGGRRISKKKNKRINIQTELRSRDNNA